MPDTPLAPQGIPALRHQPPGPVVLFGSGETSPSGQAIYDAVFRRLAPPVRVAVLETPAGFQPNSALVAGEVGDYLRIRLQNYRPEVTVVPARARGTSHSPDDPATVAPMLGCNAIFLGPGSPTYAARQLRGSLAWHTVVGLHRLGAAVILASAAAIACGAWVLPVYEIFKAGEDLHWQPGLDLFGPFGLSLAFVPHWDNREGGAGLDTSRCYMGSERFQRLLAMLPDTVTVVGIDEHTALVADLASGQGRIMGRGQVTVIRGGHTDTYGRLHPLELAGLGDFRLPQPEEGVPADTWAALRAAQTPESTPPAGPPPWVIDLSAERASARARGDWPWADALRRQIADLGWDVQDSSDGPRLVFRG